MWAHVEPGRDADFGMDLGTDANGFRDQASASMMGRRGCSRVA